MPGRPVTYLAAVLVMLFGAGVATSGIASYNGIAPIAFLCLIAGAGVLGVHFRSNRDWRSLSAYSILSSVIGLCFLAALATSLESRELTGLWQRLLLIVLFLWCAVAGVRAYRLSASSSSPSNGGLQPAVSGDADRPLA